MPIAGQPPKVSVLNIQERLEHGRTIYNIYCASCHGRNGAGDGPIIEAAAKVGGLDHTPPNFNEKGFFLDKTDRELQKNAASAPAHAHVDLDVAKSAWWHQPFSEKKRNSLIFFLRAQGLVSAPPDKVRRSAARR